MTYFFPFSPLHGGFASARYSGAQTTIISKQCAERCNILRLMDTRFQGVARGVGTAKIHGRIHLALMTLMSEVFEISLTVMDSVGGGYDVLLGLDMLRKHAAVIDLQDNCLRIGGVAVPFLGEADIPKSMREQDEGEADKSGGGPSEQPSDVVMSVSGSTSVSGPESASGSGSAAVAGNEEAVAKTAERVQQARGDDGSRDDQSGGRGDGY